MNGTDPRDCLFCLDIEAARNGVAANDLAVARYDNFPISKGHTLIVPRRHIADWFDLTNDEQAAILALAREVRATLTTSLAPDGWNIGLNIGAAGGQTLAHAHLHLIPRYAGDRPDPRGGVRWTLPDQARYWD